MSGTLQNMTTTEWMRGGEMCDDLKMQFEHDMRDYDLDFSLTETGDSYSKKSTRIAYKAFLFGYRSGLRG